MTYRHLHMSQNHMATTFHFTVSVPVSRLASAQYYLAQLCRQVGELENELTEFRELSPVYQLNHAPAQTAVTFTPAGLDLLERAFTIEAATERAFSPLTKSRDPFAAIGWDRASRTVWKKSDGTWLGFGAIGKGFALDQIRTALLQEGYEDFILGAGGSSLILSGFSDPTSRTPWSWGWSWETDKTGEPLGVPLIHESGRPIALGVSGTQEQGNHIHDPRTGQAVVARKTALVATPSAADADALSTATFVDGMEKTDQHFARLGVEAAAATIDSAGVPHWNVPFQRLWGGVLSLAFFALTFLYSLPARADEVVDLGDVAIDDFTPYAVERNGWWALLPLFALGVVALHLKDSRPRENFPPLSHNPSSEDPK